MSKRLLCGLDLGDSKICCAIAQQKDDAVQPLGIGHAPNRGFKQGYVTDLSAAVEAIEAAIQRAEQEARLEVHRGLVSIHAPAIRSVRARAVVGIADHIGEVRAKDVERLRMQAESTAVSLDRAILHSLPFGFTLDNHDGITNPVGLMGSKLALDVHLITVPQALLHNYTKAVNLAGLDVEQFLYSGVATTQAVIKPEELSLGAVVCDVGGSVTDVVVLSQDHIRYVETLPWGSDRITEALMRQLKLPQERAESLKRSFLYNRRGEVWDAVVGEARSMLGDVRSGLERSGLTDAFIATVVMSGRGAMLEGFLELAEEVLQLPVRLGAPAVADRTLTAEQRLLVATAIGLMQHERQRQDDEQPAISLAGGSWLRRAVTKAQNIFEDYF